MRNLKKLTLTLVALFAMTTDAWADDLKVTQIKFDDHPTWGNDRTVVSTADLPGFTIASEAEAKAWTGAPSSGTTVLLYEYDTNQNTWKYIQFEDGGSGTASTYNFTRDDIMGLLYNGHKVYYTGTAAPAGTALTPDADRKVWTLDAMPASNVELQVAYFPGMFTLAKADGGTIAVDGVSMGEPTAFTVPTTWLGDATLLSAADLPADFAAIDDADLPTTIAAMTSDPFAFLIYGFDGTKTKIARYVNGINNMTYNANNKRSDILSITQGGGKVYYTATVIPTGFDTDGTNIYVTDGTAFKVNVTPAEDYRLKSLMFGTTDITKDVKDGIAALTMPTGNADIKLTATFTDQFDLTFQAANTNTIEQGMATVSVGDGTTQTAATLTDGKLSVKAGQTVTLTAASGYKFRSVEAKKAGAAAAYTLLSAATTADHGKVVCAAGHLHDAKTAVPVGCTAVGILGKVTSEGHGLILALKSATGQNWNTINGWASVTTYAGTMLKVLPNDAARGSLTSYTTLGATAVSNWAVAQKNDYEAIFTNLGSTQKDNDGTTYDDNVNAFITTGVGGTEISGSNWSATGFNTPKSWDFESNFWNYRDKDGNYGIRPVLGF